MGPVVFLMDAGQRECTLVLKLPDQHWAVFLCLRRRTRAPSGADERVRRR
jgi:hypothetical protein